MRMFPLTDWEVEDRAEMEAMLEKAATRRRKSGSG